MKSCIKNSSTSSGSEGDGDKVATSGEKETVNLTIGSWRTEDVSK